MIILVNSARKVFASKSDLDKGDRHGRKELD